MKASPKVLIATFATVSLIACVQPKSSLSSAQQAPGASSPAAPLEYQLQPTDQARLLDHCNRLRDGLNEFPRSAQGTAGATFEKVQVASVSVENIRVSNTGSPHIRLITADVMVELADAQRSRFALVEGLDVGLLGEIEGTPDRDTGKVTIKGYLTERWGVRNLVNAESVLKVDSYPKLLAQAVADLATRSVEATGGFNRPFSLFNVLSDLDLETELRAAKASSSFTAGVIREIVDRKVREVRLSRASAVTREAQLAEVRTAVLADLERVSRGEIPDITTRTHYLDPAVMTRVRAVLARGGR